MKAPILDYDSLCYVEDASSRLRLQHLAFSPFTEWAIGVGYKSPFSIIRLQNDAIDSIIFSDNPLSHAIYIF